MKIDERLRSQFAFPLVPTNVEGVFTTPPLPDDLDLRTASDETRKRHGVFVPRPPFAVKNYRVIAPQLGPLRKPKLRKPLHGPVSDGSVRVPLSLAPPTITASNWCGCMLPPAKGAPNWASVSGIFTLPYLSLSPQDPTGNVTAPLSAWVGLDGWAKSGSFTLFQSTLEFEVATWKNPMDTFIDYPGWQWWIPAPDDASASALFAGGVIMNAPPLHPGDVVQLYCAYMWGDMETLCGAVQFAFYPAGEAPVLISSLFYGPQGLSNIGATIEWILENEAVTDDQPGFVLPVFSAAANSIKPLTFTKCSGSAQKNGPPGNYTGDPLDGDKVLFDKTQLPAGSKIPTVTLAHETVSITYE